jgi:hypothetical protein
LSLFFTCLAYFVPSSFEAFAHIHSILLHSSNSYLSTTMATCLSPVNLSAPMSAFFLKPAGSAYAPFTREVLAPSVVTRQPRGPPAPNATTRSIPAPVSVAQASTLFSSWRERVASGPAEMPTPPNTPKSSPTFKSGKRKGGRRSGSQSPKPTAQKFIADEIETKPTVQAAPSSPALDSSGTFINVLIQSTVLIFR